jgi:PAS domain S-box-containing protein
MFERILGATPTAMLVVGTDGTVEFVNDEVLRLFGYERDELVGRPVEILVPLSLRAAHPAARNAFIAAPTRRPMGAGRDLYAARKDGSEFPVEIGLTPIPTSTGAKTVCAVVDLSERKRSERELRETNRRLETALSELAAAQSQLVQRERLAALGRMASGIAHDLNNTLAPILGYSELLLERAEAVAPRVIEDLRLTNLAARDAASVVRRLREFFRPRAPDQTSTSVDVNDLVRDAVAISEPKWKDEKQGLGATVRVRTFFGAPPPVEGDVAELREALLNLIFNALDAMPNGGTLTFATAAREGEAEIRVQDDGVGMTEEVRLRCFEPFFSTKGERGTGLGLAQVWGAVRRHGGGIGVESSEGSGTTFVLTLPRRKSEAAPPAPATPPPPPPLRVLLVDDEPLPRDVIRRYLEIDGHAVAMASNAAEALELSSREPYDLVVTDNAMPGMSGEKLAAALKESFPRLPIIMLTGFGAVWDEHAADRLAVDCVLSKPVTLSDWRRAVAALHVKHRG